MSKAYDKIAAGLDDVLAGRYTVVRHGDEPVPPPAAETESEAVARALAEQEGFSGDAAVSERFLRRAAAALAASAKWRAGQAGPDLESAAARTDADNARAELARETTARVNAEAREERLREALLDAIECVVDWSGYASDYFKDKHDLSGDLERLRAALSGKEDANG